MHLWNDYEGVTIAGKWKLGKLLRTEGRSALFATSEENGRPAVLRLTEALNDQAVLQARYRAIQAAGDRYLVRVEQFGDAEQDGTPLSYAVLEPTQESLADILAERKLDAEETQEVATNVAGALTALHAQGLVHGAVEPENVLAAQGQIKLRSDCARPAPAPQDEELEGMVTRRSDAIGLAGIVYRSLTRNRLRGGADALALPEPFASIVRNGMRGTWGVPEMQAELERHKPREAGASAGTAEAGKSTPNVVISRQKVDAAPTEVVDGKRPGRMAPVAASVESAAATGSTPLSSRAAREVRSETGLQHKAASRRRRRAVLVAAIALIVLIFAYLLFGGKGSKTAPATAARESAVPAQSTSAERGAVLPQNQAVVTKPSPQETERGGERRETWRVIAVTYNRRDQAASRAASINQKHKDLHAQVWQQPGKPRFMVILGGAMERQEAFNLRAQAIREGLPGDVYARNYSR